MAQRLWIRMVQAGSSWERYTARQMADSYTNISQFRPQSQSQPQGRRALNDNAGIITCGTNDPTGDLGRGFGRGRCPRGQGGGNLERIWLRRILDDIGYKQEHDTKYLL